MHRLMPRFLDPKNDLVFKLLFSQPGCEDLLISLLTAVLQPPSPIVAVEFLDRDLPRDHVTDRGVVLDVRVRYADRSQVNVEMQPHPRPATAKRAQYHWARTHGGQIVRGDQYSALRPAICIFFLDFVLPPERFHCKFEVREATGHERLDDQFELHFVQLPLLGQQGDAAVHEQATSLRNWARYFKASSSEELEALAMSDPIFDKAKQELERLSLDPEVRRRALDREEALAMYRMEMFESRREGIEEGRARGKAEGRAEGKAEGKAEGRAEGRAEAVEALVTAVLRVLERRGIEVPEDARARISGCQDPAQLGAWLHAAIGATRLDDVLGG